MLGGAGGAPSNGVIKSLREHNPDDYLIGMCSMPSDLLLADVEERYVVPYADAPDYPDQLFTVIKKKKPNLK